MSFSSNDKAKEEEARDETESTDTQPKAESSAIQPKKSRKKQQKQLHINRFKQKAEYDGRTKYEKPRYAYHYNYKYRHLDTSQPITTVAYEWFKQSRKDSFEFLLDMTFRGDIDAVMFKVAGFTKRQVSRTLSLMNWLGQKSYYTYDAIKHGLIHMGHGLKNLAKDGKWVVK